MNDKVISFAQEDDRIRWVALGGSRANKDIIPDAYQDYDIEMGVNDLSSFLGDDSWLSQFGTILIMQKPEAMTLFPASLGGRFTYLMQFEDGSRLDLMLTPINGGFEFDKANLILLDKDDILSKKGVEVIPWQKEIHLEDCMNEFLWLSFYVVKGYKRKQRIYAMDHLASMRDMVLLVLSWASGKNPGASYKYLEDSMDSDLKERIYATYDIRNLIESFNLLFELMEEAISNFEFDMVQFWAVKNYHDIMLRNEEV